MAPIQPRDRKMHDSGISFEEYYYYAQKTRELERNQPLDNLQKRTIKDVIFHRAAVEKDTVATTGASAGSDHSSDEHEKGGHGQNGESHAVVTDDDWANASRMMRTASWGAGFYLITTDILGPYGVGFALGTMGWGPGIALYTVFAAMAGYSGFLLWQCYMGLDSYEFPLRNYGDIPFRLFGSVARHVTNVIQVIQLIAILGQVIILNGQGISQTSKFKLCYAVCCVLFVIAGFFLGQVRTLGKYGGIATAAVFINLLVIFISMGVMANSPPNYAISVLGSSGSAVDPTTIKPDANGVYPPIIHYAGLPNPSSLIGSINGLMQGVFAYGGAMLFVEIMAEMRRPHDFIKSMWSAQFFIWVVYLTYGCVVYGLNGQYSYQISYQGVSIYAWQVVGDMLALCSGLIAAGLYGNIGVKVFYNNVLVDLLRAPPLTSKTGKWLWIVIVPIWWSIAFIIAASIPNYFGFVSVVAAFCIIQFSYSFPPILALGFYIHKYALREGEGFNPATGEVIRRDTGIKRWMRGLTSGPWYLNIWHFILAGGSLATAGLGAYVACEAMIEAFKIPQINAFTCTSPLNLNG